MTDVKTDVWESNTTAAQVAERIRASKTVVLLTHAKPDGDALGSTLAIARAINLSRGGLTGVNSAAECWYAGPMPRWTDAITGSTKVRVFEAGKPAAGTLDPELVVVCDTGSWNQLEPFEGWLRERHDKVIVIDHHLRGSADVSPTKLITTTDAAVCQTAGEVSRLVLGLDRIADLPADIAEVLYLGLATDTGWFRHSNVTPAVLRFGAELLEAGVDYPRLLELVEQRERPARLRLMQAALGTLEFVPEKRLAMMSLTAADFAAAEAAPGESGGFVDLLQSVESVRVAVLMTEQMTEDGPRTKLSLRSKESPWNGKPAVDVNEVAHALGGGGHARAAGARVLGPIAQAKAELIEALP